MTSIMSDVRNVFNTVNQKQINLDQIMQRVRRQNPAKYNQKAFTQDNVLDALKHYEQLGVTYVDDENNVIIL